MDKSSANQRIGQLKLEGLAPKPVTVSFDAQEVSGNGGVLLVSQIEKTSGLIAGAADKLEDHRTQSMIKHNQFELVFQRVLQIVAGFETGSSSNFLRFDPVLKTAAGRNPLTGEDLASQASQSRLETNRKYKELYELAKWMVDYYISSHSRPPKRLTLDFDGSAIETYGLQLKAMFRGGPYSKYMYFPLFVFDQNGRLLVAALRPGDHGEVKLMLPILKRLVERLRKAWPNTRITVRADGAFTDPELYRWLDDNKVGYVLGLKNNNALKTHSKQFCKAAEKKFKRKFGEPKFVGKGGKKRKIEEMKDIRSTTDPDERVSKQRKSDNRKVRVFAEFRYAAGSWDRQRTVIARCDYTDDGIDVRYVLTNLSGSTEQVYLEYRLRSRCEMWIKHFKETRADKLSCSQFKSNMFRLLMHALAYILMHEVRSKLDGKHIMSIEQFRRRFINVSVIFSESANSINIRISRSYPDAHPFRLLSKRLGAESLIAA